MSRFYFKDNVKAKDFERNLSHNETLYTNRALGKHKGESIMTALMRLRRKHAYQDAKRKYRKLLGIPLEGHSRRQMKNLLRRGIGIPPQMEAVVAVFASTYRLEKRHPMAWEVAFEELFYKRPKLTFPCNVGFCGLVESNNVFLFGLENEKTKAPYGISRMVLRKIKGHDHKYTRNIKIRTFPTGIVWWEIIKSPHPKST